jgi:microcystin degradation protein MlrC
MMSALPTTVEGRAMHVLIAMMNHETNTFSPVVTDLDRFAQSAGERPLTGQAAIDAYKGTGTGVGAFIELAQEAGATFDVAICAHAQPSGPVEDEAFEAICDAIVTALRQQTYDAIFLDLHGAMVTRRFEDGEGELLRRVRAVAPDTPLAVAYDMHANIHADMVELADTVAGYQTYPHIDMHGTGLRAGRALMRLLQGQAQPTTAWGRAPMIPHVMRQGSDDEPNRSLQARAREMEKQGALCASVFVGFPHADIANAGLSAVVVTDNDPELAQRWCDELLGMAWAHREAFVYAVEPLTDSVSRAARLQPERAGPIVLLDHYDNAASGGTMDTTAVLAEVLRQGLNNVAAFAIYDPDAVQVAIAAGVGAQLELPVGGKLTMPQVPHTSEPLTLSGVVKTISLGRFKAKGPMSAGAHMDMGHAAVIDTGSVEVVLISRHIEPFDANALLSLGIDPMQKRFILLKSRIHWRAGLGQLAAATIECAGAGVCTSDFGELDFQQLRRPIYPLDADTDWHA